MAIDAGHLPFSQRNGFEPIPEQLKLGQASSELRRLIDYCITLEIDREKSFSYGDSYFEGRWKRVSQDFHVHFLELNARTYSNDATQMKKNIERFIDNASFHNLFDLVEFFVRHDSCSKELKSELAQAFVAARSAYRIVDWQVIAVGSDLQAVALAKALEAAEAAGAAAARSHLVAAGRELHVGNWAGSVRESVHAVESMALRLAPDARNLGPALTRLEKDGHLHGGLKAAFSSLYGYASEEKGIRHSLVFKDEALVDEADALFMLGACASFVSYLIARVPDK